MSIGIDFGGSFATMAAWMRNRQKIEVIGLDSGARSFPVVVSFHDAEIFFAEDARRVAVKNSKSTLFDIKHLIGKSHSEASNFAEKNSRSYEVVSQENDDQFTIKFPGLKGGTEFTAENILEMILTKMKSSAEASMHTKITECVISVPLDFTSQQCTAITNAAHKSGMKTRCLINDPTAACIACGLDLDESVDQKNILVFDCGGTSCDVTLLSVHSGLFHIEAHTSTSSVTSAHIVDELVKHFAKQFEAKFYLDLLKDSRATEKLRFNCERILLVLSSSASASLAIDSLYEGNDFHSRISRARFEQMCSRIFQEAVDCAQSCLIMANMDKRHLHKVLIIGGLANVPSLVETVKDCFADNPSIEIVENLDIPPEELVAHGAAIQAALLSHIYPDQEAPSPGQIDEINTSQLNLGIRVQGDELVTMIPKGSKIPAKVTKEFSYAETHSIIELYEGENRNSEKAILLGSLSTPSGPNSKQINDATSDNEEPADLPPLQKDPIPPLEPTKVEVVLEIDGNGNITLTANSLRLRIATNKIPSEEQKQQLESRDAEEKVALLGGEDSDNEGKDDGSDGSDGDELASLDTESLDGDSEDDSDDFDPLDDDDLD